MFSKFFHFVSSQTTIQTAFQDSIAMLRKAQTLFLGVSEHFLRGVEPPFNVYGADREINDLEVKIRGNVLKHLSINPHEDLVSSLILTSIIIDIERIGDLSKNINELQTILRDIPRDPQWVDELNKITDMVSESFDRAVEAFDKEDKAVATKVMDAHRLINSEVEKIIRGLADDDNTLSRKAITFALYGRYLKRVSAHLSNIVSTVLNPYDKIRYFADGKDVT